MARRVRVRHITVASADPPPPPDPTTGAWDIGPDWEPRFIGPFRAAQMEMTAFCTMKPLAISFRTDSVASRTGIVTLNAAYT